jgi:hypothetical protein
MVAIMKESPGRRAVKGFTIAKNKPIIVSPDMLPKPQQVFPQSIINHFHIQAIKLK